MRETQGVSVSIFQSERKLGRDYQVAARQRTVGTSAKGYKDGQIKPVEDYVCIFDAALPKNQRKSRLGKLNHAASCTFARGWRRCSWGAAAFGVKAAGFDFSFLGL